MFAFKLYLILLFIYILTYFYVETESYSIFLAGLDLVR